MAPELNVQKSGAGKAATRSGGHRVLECAAMGRSWLCHSLTLRMSIGSNLLAFWEKFLSQMLHLKISTRAAQTISIRCASFGAITGLPPEFHPGGPKAGLAPAAGMLTSRTQHKDKTRMLCSVRVHEMWCWY